MGVIHICGNQHKITRATIVIYSERKSRHVLIIWSCPILSGPRPLCAPQTINTYIPDNKTYGFHQLWEHSMFILIVMRGYICIDGLEVYYPRGQDDQVCKELPPRLTHEQ